MEYFLCIENTPYYHWQAELLLESFRHHNCQDQLLISVVPSDVPTLQENVKLLAEHKRHVSPSVNIGRQRGYAPLNKLYNLLAVVESGAIKPPFALIEPDMVMYRPLQVNQDHNICFQIDPTLSPSYVEENCKIQKHLKIVAKGLTINEQDAWLPVGKVIVFNVAPLELFRRVIAVCEKLATEQIVDKGEIWSQTDQVAWALTLLEYYGQMSYEAVYDYEMNMLENTTMCNFVNYEHGIPPIFSKYMFQYQGPNLVVLSGESPIEFLSKPDIAVSAAAHYVQQLANSYSKRK